jgi:D-tyrosyl-tRNA(Tyr) deacylase
MIACVQRVSQAKVEIDGKTNGEIGRGLLVLFGVEKGDDIEKTKLMAEKVCNLRIFKDEDGKMSLSVKDIEGEILIISQFTLAGETSKGNRPDFGNAASPDIAENLYTMYINFTRSILGADKVGTGIFGASMQVSLTNDGPVTILVRK